MGTTQPFDPKIFHEQILQRFRLVPEKQIVAHIHTDGSGHEDGFAGSGMAVIPRGKPRIEACAAETHSSTERGEFYALIRGLAILEDALGWDLRDKEAAAAARNVHVAWHTDREGLALCAMINPVNGLPYYTRRTCMELWAAFGYYASFLQIHALFEPRNTTLEGKLVDELASDSRQTLKNYYTTFRDNH